MLGILDIRTVSFTTILFCCVFGIGLVLFHITLRRYRGISLVGIGELVFGAGFVLLSQRDLLDPMFTVIIANVLITCGIAVVVEGFFRFYGYSGILRLVGPALVIVLCILFLYFTYRKPSTNTRIIIISISMTLMFASCAFVHYRSVPSSARTTFAVTGIPFIAYSVFYLVRALWTLGESAIVDFMAAGPIHGVAFIVAQLSVITMSFAIVWMVSALLQHELSDQARIDELTQILNRRGMEEAAERIVSQSMRDGTPMSIIMADIDHFKRFNDTYGHKTGDDGLRQVAMVLRDNVRSSDVIARFGGEEFVVVLPNTTAEGARSLAEKLRERTEQHGLVSDGEKMELTASFGVTTASAPMDLAQVLSKADEALYLAKRNGRNRVEAL